MASGRIWLHAFILVFFCLSYLLPILCCHTLPYFCPSSPFYPSLLQSALTIFGEIVAVCRWEAFPVCFSWHWYHQLCPHILPCASVLPTWHKTNPDLGMSKSTQGGVLFLDLRTRHHPSVSEWSHSSCSRNQAKVHQVSNGKGCKNSTLHLKQMFFNQTIDTESVEPESDSRKYAEHTVWRGLLRKWCIMITAQNIIRTICLNVHVCINMMLSFFLLVLSRFSFKVFISIHRSLSKL